MEGEGGPFTPEETKQLGDLIDDMKRSEDSPGTEERTASSVASRRSGVKEIFEGGAQRVRELFNGGKVSTGRPAELPGKIRFAEFAPMAI
jgi:hypothetical protein